MAMVALAFQLKNTGRQGAEELLVGCFRLSLRTFSGDAISMVTEAGLGLRAMPPEALGDLIIEKVRGWLDPTELNILGEEQPMFNWQERTGSGFT